MHAIVHSKILTLKKFDAKKYSAAVVTAHAQNFSNEQFAKHIKDYLQNALKEQG
jgi:hypothetical protein